MSRIAILGAGGFGTALALMCDQQRGHDVTLWTHREEEAIRLNESREQPKLLPGIKIPTTIQITSDTAKISGQDIVLIATPSYAVRETCRKIKPYITPNVVLVCVSKGLEQGTYQDFSSVMEEEFPNNANVILSGPSHAEEIARGQATTVVAASKSEEAAQYIQDEMMNPALRIYVNDDVIGVELGGALKNIIAVSAGIADGLGIGDNAKAALMTRGITEIARLGEAMGGRQETFGGLSGIGDLIVTCTSLHSRNRRFGILIGQGRSVQEALDEVGMVVEGYSCTRLAYELSQQKNVEMPITQQAYEVLYRGKNPNVALRDLMARPKRHESESVWIGH